LRTPSGIIDCDYLTDLVNARVAKKNVAKKIIKSAREIYSMGSRCDLKGTQYNIRRVNSSLTIEVQRHIALVRENACIPDQTRWLSFILWATGDARGGSME
jgi:hypothetical protein